MYDAVFVLVEAFNKLLKKKPDQFRSYTMRRSGSQHTYTNSSYGNLIANGQSMRVLDCNIAKGWINPVIYLSNFGNENNNSTENTNYFIKIHSKIAQNEYS